jgi:hypothetical protein
MPKTTNLSTILAMLACVGASFPQLVRADETARSSSSSPVQQVAQGARVNDVALQPGNSLTGKLESATGAPTANANIELKQGPRLVATTTTNAAGEFRFEKVRGGVYEVVSPIGQRVVRCWQPGTAPPSAVAQLAVDDTQVIRGQAHPLAVGLANPWVITGIVVAAIAIPVALHENRNDRNASE